jgi:hypothetical protein
VSDESRAIQSVLDSTEGATQSEVGEDHGFADLLEIEGNLATFTAVLAKRYGTTQNSEVNTWANRRYSHWSGNYTNAYLDPVKAS